MKDQHSIDDIFRESINHYGISPSDKVWASLDKKLQAKASASNKSSKSGKTYLTGIITILGSLALLGTYYILAKNDNSNIVARSAKKESLKAVPDNANTTSINVNTAANNTNETTTKPNSFVVLRSKGNTNEKAQVPSNESDKITSNVNPILFTDRFEKSEPEPFIPMDKKDNSDKAILLMPYFPSNQAQNNSGQNTSNAANANAVEKSSEPQEVVGKTAAQQNIFYVPNAFTPNADGLNDVFAPQTNETFKEYKLYIFDRGGNTIFYSDEVHRGWDGHAVINGNDVIKEDIYMWRIEIKNNKGEKEHMMGYINLIK